MSLAYMFQKIFNLIFEYETEKTWTLRGNTRFYLGERSSLVSSDVQMAYLYGGPGVFLKIPLGGIQGVEHSGGCAGLRRQGKSASSVISQASLPRHPQSNDSQQLLSMRTTNIFPSISYRFLKKISLRFITLI